MHPRKRSLSGRITLDVRSPQSPRTRSRRDNDGSLESEPAPNDQLAQYTTLQSQVSYQPSQAQGGILKNRPNQSTFDWEARRDGNNTSWHEMSSSPGKKGVRIMDESTDSQVFQNGTASRSPMTLHRTENFYAKPNGKKLTQMASQIKILDQAQLLASEELAEGQKNYEKEGPHTIGISV